jgi:hypothetical protein
MDIQKLLNQFANPFMKLILRSPLHGLVSSNTLLITVTGRKSGKSITTPTNYLRDGDTLTIISFKERTWWRNVRGGAAVAVCLQGRDMPGKGLVIEDTRQVADGLATFLTPLPHYARYFRISLSADGKPSAEDVTRAAQTRVIVQVKLN